MDVVDNFDSSYQPAIKRANVAHNLDRGGYRLHEIDMRDGASRDGALQNAAFEDGVRTFANWMMARERERTAVAPDGVLN